MISRKRQQKTTINCEACGNWSYRQNNCHDVSENKSKNRNEIQQQQQRVPTSLERVQVHMHIHMHSYCSFVAHMPNPKLIEIKVANKWKLKPHECVSIPKYVWCVLSFNPFIDYYPRCKSKYVQIVRMTLESVSHSVCVRFSSIQTTMKTKRKKQIELTTCSTIIGSAFIQVYTFHKNLNFIHDSRRSQCFIFYSSTFVW